MAEFLRFFDIPWASAAEPHVFLWRRIPHPDTLVSGGPEIDAGIMTENALILCEAKWQSEVGTVQGKKKDKDQIQLRGEFLKQYGAKLFPRASVRAVVGLSLFHDSFTNTAPSDVLFRCATWEDVCSLPSHLHADEVRRYFCWKKENTRMANNRLKDDRGHAAASRRPFPGALA